MEKTGTNHLKRDQSLAFSLPLSVFSLRAMELFLIVHPTEVAVMFKCRTTLNTLVEILLALHLALFLCSVWSWACTVLRWILSSEESSIKGALIIHDARFRFVPHCSETENSPLCYFAEELWISFFKFDVQFNNFFLPSMIYCWSPFYCKCSGASTEGWIMTSVCAMPLSIIRLTEHFTKAYLFWK